MIRLYFNRHGEKPWSVDEGHGTPERTYLHVVVGAQGRTNYRPLKPEQNPQETPCAWIEFRGARLVEYGLSAHIVPV